VGDFSKNVERFWARRREVQKGALAAYFGVDRGLFAANF